MSKDKHEDRDSQIKDAVFRGNLRRAQELTKRSISRRVSKNRTLPYRGNKDEEQALEILNYKQTEPEPQRQLKVKAAKIYHEFMGMHDKPYKWSDRDNEHITVSQQLEKKYNIELSDLSPSDMYDNNNKSTIVLDIYEGLSKRVDKRKRSRGLEQSMASASLAIIGFIGSILFLSNNITGNVIGLNQTSTSWIGGILFVIALIASFIYFKRKK